MRWRFWPARRHAPPDDRAELGHWGENLAARELRRRGYELLDRNVRVARGEIDLVARDAGTLVFVEVKTRRSGPFGLAREAVTSTKAVRLTRLGLEYLARHGLQDVDWRIDVVAIDVAPDGGYQVDVIPNAIGD